MAGFEGYEKRLELNFSGDDPAAVVKGRGRDELGLGLRRLPFESLEKVLHAVQCTVVSAVANHYFDAYVLSESSLFVYPTKIIIKTCGTTQLLKSIRPLLIHAADMGLILCGCRYTRGSFIFPKSQPYPHTSFREEINYLETRLPNSLIYRKAAVMDSSESDSDHHQWHVFTASDGTHFVSDEVYTVEVCMTELDPVLAGKFFRRPGKEYSGDLDGKEMTAITGIGEINPHAIVCDYGFDPCGYSMNGVDMDRYSTIHVTPEEGFSYASFEMVGESSGGVGLGEVLRKVAKVFRPATMSVATTSAGGREVWTRVKSALEPMGLKRRSVTADEFPAVGSVVFQTFATRRN